jgi:hypothetical protein
MRNGNKIFNWHCLFDSISSYAPTVEPKTALKKLIETGKLQPNAQEHFII